ncbi:FtsX-like permease family protein [Cecembia rubra]|uniref:FtsX-like permease family protein n=1 Tax=Cecembia rubra TaxID=1485585 RepID=UPI002714A43C|nr:FtsX-like permease family protein [Cecembia rubra]
MWKNYFKISFRNLKKRKLYTGINVLGLTIAILSFLAISLYIYHEWSYDRMYTDYQRIYKFNQEFTSNGEIQTVQSTPSMLVPVLLEEFDEVETATLVFDLSMFSSVVVEGDDLLVEEDRFAFVDERFFEVFDFELLAGSKEKVLTEPNQLVLPFSTASRYFGNALDAMGKNLKVDGADYVVSGVMKDFPSNSHLDFDLLGSFKTHRHGRNPEWMPSNYLSYAKLKPGVDHGLFQEKISQMVEKYFGEMQRSYGFQTAFHYQPVTSIHLGDSSPNAVRPAVDVKNLYIFGLVALLLIFIGVINYINLATAEATERNKEVGMRKVLGASRKQLFGQFVSESFLLTLSAIIISITLLYFLNPIFENLSGVGLQLELIFTPIGLFFLFVLLLSVGLLSGFYPSLILSHMEPLKALGKHTKAGSGAWLRKSLVIFQFFVSISLLIATLVVHRQLQYMQEVNLGYEREELIVMGYHYRMGKSIDSFQNELMRQGLVQSVSLAADMPIFIKAGYRIFPGGDNQKEIMITGYSGDYKIAQTLGLNLLEGNDFVESDLSRSQASESNSIYYCMLNESAAGELGWSSQEAIGKKIDFGGGLTEIKAVVSNFYFNSLHHQVGPLAILIDPDNANVILAKLPKGNPSAYLFEIEKNWKAMFPGRPFNYKFVDQEYARMYRAEERIGTIFSLFAGIAVFIACMGLFGLVSYVALRRTREISIRKVLGARAGDVLKMLSADFFGLLMVSALLAIGFGIWFSDSWLSDFAYKTTIPVWIYVMAIAFVFLISMLTVGYRTLKVFSQNPVSSLKED